MTDCGLPSAGEGNRSGNRASFDGRKYHRFVLSGDGGACQARQTAETMNERRSDDDLCWHWPLIAALLLATMALCLAF